MQLEIVVLRQERDGFVDCGIVEDLIWYVVQGTCCPSTRRNWKAISMRCGYVVAYGWPAPCIAPLSSIVSLLPPASALAAALASAALLPINLLFGAFTSVSSSPFNSAETSGPRSAIARSSSILSEQLPPMLLSGSHVRCDRRTFAVNTTLMVVFQRGPAVTCKQGLWYSRLRLPPIQITDEHNTPRTTPAAGCFSSVC
jgi:hypothetical protein